MLESGRKAPEFELQNQDGETVRLSDFEGEYLVLYFYPRADTPGCTKEACAFRDSWERFEALGVDVVGVSNDPVEDLKPFQREYDLPFELLSDEGGDVASTYESFGTAEIRGETWHIAFRNTFILDEDNTIVRVYEDVSPDTHAEEILADLGELRGE
jgi:peroxiredoxin Q/BCP